MLMEKVKVVREYEIFFSHGCLIGGEWVKEMVSLASKLYQPKLSVIQTIFGIDNVNFKFSKLGSQSHNILSVREHIFS